MMARNTISLIMNTCATCPAHVQRGGRRYPDSTGPRARTRARICKADCNGCRGATLPSPMCFSSLLRYNLQSALDEKKKKRERSAIRRWELYMFLFTSGLTFQIHIFMSSAYFFLHLFIFNYYLSVLSIINRSSVYFYFSVLSHRIQQPNEQCCKIIN